CACCLTGERPACALAVIAINVSGHPMDAPQGHERNADQIAYWNGPGGQRWSDRQAAQDLLLAPISDILSSRIAAKPGKRILDIGCGCGGLSIALAGQVAPEGSVLGVDISAPMLARA